MNRWQWMFTGLVALLMVLVAGLVFLVRVGQSMSIDDDAPLQTGEFDALPTSPPPMTAREGHLAALSRAREWSEDARLWQAQATWPVGSDLQSPAVAWTYTFYSQKEDAVVDIVVTPGMVTLQHTRAVRRAPSLVNVDRWAVDSPEAYDVLYASGGEAFMTIHPKRSLKLTLFAEEPLRWQATVINEGPLGNAAGRQMFDLLFSAQDGSLITSPLQEGFND